MAADGCPEIASDWFKNSIFMMLAMSVKLHKIEIWYLWFPEGSRCLMVTSDWFYAQY